VILHKSIYDPIELAKDGYRLLVARLWPRGVRKTAVDSWDRRLGGPVELIRKKQTGKLTKAELRRTYLATLDREALADAAAEGGAARLTKMKFVLEPDSSPACRRPRTPALRGGNTGSDSVGDTHHSVGIPIPGEAAMIVAPFNERLDLGRYDTDKIENGYLEIYDRVFRSRAEQEVRLLELGVLRGGSLRLWRDYFPEGRIVGLEVHPIQIDDPEKRIRVYLGRQEDTALLTRIAEENAPEGFDIIIDDACHFAEPARISFWHLFEHHLKPGGLYAIEDWGTGYWQRWPDGRRFRPPGRWWTSILRFLKKLHLVSRIGSNTHRYGMVGFIKELIDEQGMRELSREYYGKPFERESKFESVLVTRAIVFVTKAGTRSGEEKPLR